MTSRRDRGETRPDQQRSLRIRSFPLSLSIPPSFTAEYRHQAYRRDTMLAQGEAAEPPERGREEQADTHLLHTSISNLLMRRFHPSILISTCHPTWQVERCILQTVSSSLMRTARRF